MNRSVERAGLRISVDETGTRGSPCVLIHSSGMTSRQWKHLAERLAPSHRVLLPDLIGYGASMPWPRERPFHFMLDVLALEALLDSMEEPAHLVGHSYGGLVALHAALHRPAAVRSLALAEPVAFGVLYPDDSAAMQSIDAMPFGSPTLPDTPEAREQWLTWFVDYWNGPGAWSALPERMRSAFLATVDVCYGGVASLLGDRTSLTVWQTITAPMLLLRGERSTTAARRTAERLATSVPGRALYDVPGAGHMAPLTHAALVADRIIAHVDASEGT